MKRFTKILLSVFFVLSIQIAVKAQQGGYALKFDGADDYVDVGTPVATQIANNLSITVWIKPSASTGWRDILTNQWKIHESGLILAIDGASGQLHYAATGTNVSYIGRDPASNTLDGKWHHVALTFESGVFKTYLDGTLIDTYNSGLTAIKYSGGYKFLIGRDSGEGAEYFNGLIDEVSLWNTVRTEAQIKANMYKELAGTESGLVAYYKMAEGSGTTIDDASINSNTGTLTNGPAWKTSGAFSGPRQALDFDGTNDFVNLNTPAALSNLGNGSYTLEAWIKSSYVGRQAIFGNWSYSYGASVIELYNTGNLRTYVNSTGYNSTKVVTDGNWHHVAAVRDIVTGKIIMYVDGIEIYNSAGYSVAFTAPADKRFGIGANPDGAGYELYFRGNIDEIRIWNVARTESQLRENMMRTLAGNETGLAAYYRMDQSDGTTLYDISSNGNNGTLTNMDAATDWVSSSAFNTWLGTESSTWSNAANWSNSVPASAQSVGLYKWPAGSEATLSGAPTINNLLVSADASPTISSNFTATGSLMPRKSITIAGENTLTTAGSLLIESGKSVTIPSGGQLTVTGTLSNSAGNGGLAVNSGGSLIESTTGVAATVQSAIPGNQWHLVSAPVSGATSAIFEGKYLQTHSELTNSYSDVTPTTDELTAMQGFALWGSESGFTATYPGTLNTGNQSFATSFAYAGSNPADNKGWNLAGNPYPSSIDWLAATGWTKTGVNNAIYIHVNSSTWATFVGGAGVNGGTRYIAPGQGFFVQSSAAGTLAMTNAVRVHNATSFFKNADEVIPNLVRLEVSGNGYKDEAVVRFLPEATAEFDGDYDAHKLYGDVAEAAQIYSAGSTPLAINSLPETDEVMVGIKAGASGNYTIAATEVNDLQYPTLEDTKTNTFTDLNKGTYSFDYTVGESDLRFILHMGTLGMEEKTETRIAQVYAADSRVYVRMNDVDLFTHLSIYDLSGRLVSEKALARENVQSFGLDLPSGAYLVRLRGDFGTACFKIIL